MQLDVAAYGWLDEAWSASYPDDLPLEWRLDYYANEYRAVVVPCGHWSKLDDETLLEWIDDSHRGFEFFWEVGGAGDAQRLLALYRVREAMSPPGGWLMMPGCEIEPPLERELLQLAPVAHCTGSGECEGGISLIAVEEGVNLRQLREHLDVLKASDVVFVLLVVMPSPGAGATLEQLQTLCQLYGG